MINQDFFLALDALEKEKGITQAEFITALEDSLAIACKKAFGVAYGVTPNAFLQAIAKESSKAVMNSAWVIPFSFSNASSAKKKS